MINEAVSERERRVYARFGGCPGDVRIERSRASEGQVLLACHGQQRFRVGPAQLRSDIDRRFFRGPPIDERDRAGEASFQRTLREKPVLHRQKNAVR